jgi:hypothetical protein
MKRAGRDQLHRVRARPRPEDWTDDETMTLIEAVGVFFPDGPLTLSSLRTAIDARKLDIVTVAGKHLTTPRAVRKLVTPCPAAKPSRHDYGSVETKAYGSSSTPPAERDGKSAQASAAMKLKAQRARSKPISALATPRPPGRPILVSSR